MQYERNSAKVFVCSMVTQFAKWEGVSYLAWTSSWRYLFFLFNLSQVKIPSVGRAEKLKPQEAIPPFSLIEDSIQGRRAETLVKTA